MASSSNPSSLLSPSFSKFEFQAADGAWYNVTLELDVDLLTVNYFFFPSDNNEVFKASQFTTLDDLECFARRFRPSSLPLQDEECHKVLQQMRVLAACRSSHDDDVRFYDANIEEVERQDHAFEDGIELCCCNFLLHWLDGPNAGNLTSAEVADICLLQFTAETHPNLDSFLERSMEIIEKTSFCRASTSGHDSAAATGITGQSRVNFSNLGVSPLCEQRLKSYTWAVVMGNDKEEIRKLRDFLGDPNEIIVTSRGRPWVTTYKVPRLGTPTRNLAAKV